MLKYQEHLILYPNCKYSCIVNGVNDKNNIWYENFNDAVSSAKPSYYYYRRKFLKIINKYNVLVLEDDPYSLINYTDVEYKSLYELNGGKNVIYLGTFSKYISPSINVGYILSDKILLETIYSFKESFDLGTSLFNQLVILDYLRNNNIKSIMDNRLILYKKLLDEALRSINNNYAKSILYYSNIKGGLFIFLRFKNEIDNNVFENGSHYYVDKKYNNETRINICSLLNIN